MAILDLARKTIYLKIVYYGCALGGKTTNLVTLHRLTDPEGRQGLVSIATKNDRTLFFDLLPLDLGQIAALQVRLKIYTVPGQVHYELTRRQVLSGADGVVLVADSDPAMEQANLWAIENLRTNLKANGLDPDTLPLVFQWNKRDLPSARPVPEMAAQLNPRGRPAFEAVATTGRGVVDTFAAVVKQALRHACAKRAPGRVPEAEIEERVERALAAARERSPAGEEAPRVSFERRVDDEGYREAWAAQGRDRKIMDQETLLAEAVQTGMQLAERLEGLQSAQASAQRRAGMLEALDALLEPLADPEGDVLPAGLLRRLAEAVGRRRASLLLFRPQPKVMEEREVLPAPPDPLNASAREGTGSAAYRLSQGAKPRYIEDLHTEVFFDQLPPQAQGIGAALIVPLAWRGTTFGALAVYAALDEDPLEAAERRFWSIAGRTLALALHWHGLARKVAKLQGSSSPDTRPTP